MIAGIENGIDFSKKYYVDSDGVIADFVSWARGIRPDIIDNDGNTKEGCVDTLHKMMIDNYRECYLVFDVLPGGWEFLENVKKYENWFILTATLSIEKIRKEIRDESLANKIYDTFCENKYKWYENLGVARNKVIITGHRHDKQRFANKGDVLYDDFVDNITDWKNAGGIAYQIGNRIR